MYIAGRLQVAIFSSLNVAHDRAKLDCRSAGASLATLIAPCSSDSGILAMDASGGGSAEMKQRKSGCAPSASNSSWRSSAGSHEDIKWTFCRRTHPPLAARSFKQPMARASWPWPMEMLTSRPLS